MTSEANLEMLEWPQAGYTLECMSCAVDRLGSLHDSSARALQHMKTWHKGAPCEEVRLFTDGSYHEATHDMAWSIVAIVREHEEWLFAGFMSGMVAIPDDLEFGPPSAYVAEVFAILHAMVLTSNIDMVTTIKYDCTSAAEVAKNSSKQHSGIAQQMSALAAILRQINKWPCWGHVKGHSGDPFNELADVVAKAACSGLHVHPPHQEDRIVAAMSEGWLAWIWPHIASIQAPQCWPRFECDGRVTEFLSSPHEVPDCPAPFRTSTQQSSEDKALHGARYELRLATYNCLSLKLAGQLDCIEEFCVGKQLHVVGLQETKVQWNGAAHSTHFFRVGSSANNQGLEGCQLWFRKGVHFGFRSSGETFGWDLASCAVVYESARCLVVSAKAGGIEFVCISVHAHTTSSSDNDVQEFWKFLSGITSRFPPKAVRLFFLDANAHFDEWVRADAYYLPTNLNAQLLRDFAHAHSLVLSDLWSPLGEAIHTWISPQGHYRCLDFLAVPRHFQGCFQVQGSWDVLDRFAGLDHFMLGATLRFFLTDCRGDKQLERFDCGLCVLLRDRKSSATYSRTCRRLIGQRMLRNIGILCADISKPLVDKRSPPISKARANPILISKRGNGSDSRKMFVTSFASNASFSESKSLLPVLRPGGLLLVGVPTVTGIQRLGLTLPTSTETTTSVWLGFGSSCATSGNALGRR